MTDTQPKAGESKSYLLLIVLAAMIVGVTAGSLATFAATRVATVSTTDSGSSATTASKPQQIVRVNGHEIVADAGSRIIVSGTEDTTNPTATRTLTQAGESRGVGVATTEKGIANTNGELPVVNLNGSSSSGGKFSWQFEGINGSNSYLLYVFCGITGVLGAVLLWLGLRGLAFSMFALSAAFGIAGFLVETYPAVLLIVVLVGLAAGVYFLYDQWKRQQQATALKAVVSGVEASPEEAQKAVKPHIAEAAGAAAKTVKDTITAVKATLGD